MGKIELDAKDKAILKELDKNVRVSNVQIAKRTRLSKEVVQYRIKKLEQSKIINHYWALVHRGYSYTYKILIKNRNLAKQKKKEFIEFVTKQKRVAWFAETEGNFDFIITIYAKDDIEFLSIAEKIFENFGSYFQERHILKSTFLYMTNDKFLSNGKFLYVYKLNHTTPIPAHDEIDDKILTEISLNSRIRFTELTIKVNLTPEAVAVRYKNLVKKGMIKGLKIRLNFEALGLSYYHLFVTLQNQEKKSELISYYTIYPECNSIMHHVGFYDLHLEFVLPSERIDNVMDDFIAKFGESVNSYELLRIRKEHVMTILK